MFSSSPPRGPCSDSAGVPRTGSGNNFPFSSGCNTRVIVAIAPNAVHEARSGAARHIRSVTTGTVLGYRVWSRRGPGWEGFLAQTKPNPRDSGTLRSTGSEIEEHSEVWP